MRSFICFSGIDVDPNPFLDQLVLLFLWMGFKIVLKSILKCIRTLADIIVFNGCVTHACTLLLVVLVAEPVDFAPDVRLHGRMRHRERDFNEQNSGSCTERSFQLVAEDLRIVLVPRFVQ